LQRLTLAMFPFKPIANNIKHINKASIMALIAQRSILSKAEILYIYLFYKKLITHSHFFRRDINYKFGRQLNKSLHLIYITNDSKFNYDWETLTMIRK